MEKREVQKIMTVARGPLPRVRAPGTRRAQAGESRQHQRTGRPARTLEPEGYADTLRVNHRSKKVNLGRDFDLFGCADRHNTDTPNRSQSRKRPVQEA